jgi:hypothetical protein
MRNPFLGKMSHNRPFFETHCSAFSNGSSSSHILFLTNLKTHLIIRISKGQAIDGKRETKKGIEFISLADQIDRAHQEANSFSI